MFIRASQESRQMKIFLERESRPLSRTTFHVSLKSIDPCRPVPSYKAAYLFLLPEEISGAVINNYLGQMVGQPSQTRRLAVCRQSMVGGKLSVLGEQSLRKNW